MVNVTKINNKGLAMSKQALCINLVLSLGLWVVLTAMLAVVPTPVMPTAAEGPAMKTSYFQISPVTTTHQDRSGTYQIVVRPITLASGP